MEESSKNSTSRIVTIFGGKSFVATVGFPNEVLGPGSDIGKVFFLTIGLDLAKGQVICLGPNRPRTWDLAGGSTRWTDSLGCVSECD
jgi:hypothetical protein